MTLQSTINVNLGFGVPGELIEEGPQRAESLIVNSAGANPNVIGYAYTKSNTTNIAKVGGTIAAGTVFAGILANPKVYSAYGTQAGGTLAPTMQIPDQSQGEFLQMGTVVVSIAGPANIGDLVIYNQTTGALSAIAPSATPGAGSALVPNATVWRFPTTANGLVAIRLTN